jgi:hypothetical protein
MAGGWNWWFIFCVVGCVVTNISKDHGTFIFWVKHFDPEDKGAMILQNARTVHPKTQYYIPEHLHHQQHCCENLTSHNGWNLLGIFVFTVSNPQVQRTQVNVNSTNRFLQGNLTTVLNTVLKLVLYLEQRGGKLKHQVYSRTWYDCCSDSRTVVVYLQTAKHTELPSHLHCCHCSLGTPNFTSLIFSQLP